MKKLIKITAMAFCISASSLCLAQNADVKGWAKQIINAQHGAEQTALLNDLSTVFAAGVVNEWNQKIIDEVPEGKRDAVVKQLNAELDQYKADILSILKKESVNVEEQDLLNFYTQNFTPDELKAIAAWYTSPAFKKYQELTPQLAQVYMKKLEERSTKALEARQSKFNSQAQSLLNKAGK